MPFCSPTKARQSTGSCSARRAARPSTGTGCGVSWSRFARRNSTSSRSITAVSAAIPAYRHLTEELGVAPSRIILAGRSLGSAVAIDLATRVPSGGMLLLSAIDSVPARAARLYPWAPVTWLASLQFDSLAKAPRIQIPVLQVHAPGDWLVPLDTARALFARFPGRKVMLELHGGHNDVGFRDESLVRTL